MLLYFAIVLGLSEYSWHVLVTLGLQNCMGTVSVTDPSDLVFCNPNLHLAPTMILLNRGMIVNYPSVHLGQFTDKGY